MATKKERARAFGKWLLGNSPQWPLAFFVLQGIISEVGKLNLTDSKIWMMSHAFSASLIITILVVSLGALVSYWKIHALKSYASVEVLVGALLGFNSASHLSPEFNFSGLLGILSAVYVVARGFNNVSSARMAAH
jgi:hypothetical protein